MHHVQLLTYGGTGPAHIVEMRHLAGAQHDAYDLARMLPSWCGCLSKTFLLCQVCLATKSVSSCLSGANTRIEIQ